MTESRTIEREPMSVGEACPDPAAYAAWRATNPEWRPISEYTGGYVLFGFDEMRTMVYGTRKGDGSWWGFYDGEEYRMDEEYSETFRNLDGEGREIILEGADTVENYTNASPSIMPARFCEIPWDAALHFVIP